MNLRTEILNELLELLCRSLDGTQTSKVQLEEVSFLTCLCFELLDACFASSLGMCRDVDFCFFVKQGLDQSLSGSTYTLTSCRWHTLTVSLPIPLFPPNSVNMMLNINILDKRRSRDYLLRWWPCQTSRGCHQQTRLLLVASWHCT